MTLLRLAVPLSALALASPGCGDDGDDGPPAAAAPTAPAAVATTPPPDLTGSQAAVPAPTAPTATFVFDEGKLKPPVLRVPQSQTVRLVVISADGRPHTVTVRTPGGLVRVRVPAGSRAEAQLTGLRPGRSLRVESDGTRSAQIRNG